MKRRDSKSQSQFNPLRHEYSPKVDYLPDISMSLNGLNVEFDANYSTWKIKNTEFDKAAYEIEKIMNERDGNQDTLLRYCSFYITLLSISTFT